MLPSGCRLEVGWNDGDRRVTWLVTNPIYLRASDPSLQTGRDFSYFANSSEPSAMPESWAIERDPQSTAAWRKMPQATEVEFTYQLHGGERSSQYAALVSQQLTSIDKAKYLELTLRAQKPMRLSVQLRRPLDTPGAAERWVRSVYLPPQRTRVIVWFDDMRPIEAAAAAHPPLDKVHALLLVVDTEHTPPGTEGRLFVEEMRFGGTSTRSPDDRR